LRNDVPYKAVKPTRIKLQNHLSKLNVTRMKSKSEAFLRHAGEKAAASKGTLCDNPSLIFITSFADARN
jgi:hypothetical protein